MNLVVEMMEISTQSIPRGGGGEPEMIENVPIDGEYSPRRRG